MRGLWAPAIAAGALLAAAGLVAQVAGNDRADQPRPPAPVATSAHIASTAPLAPAPIKPGRPRRVVIPALGVDAPVVPVKAPDRTLVPPSNPLELGWWVDGARPGDRWGSALVTGHAVHAGDGALDHLDQLQAGDRVLVRTERARLAYVVRRVRSYTKGTVARDAAELFSQEVPGRLVVVTCGDWNGSAYLSNVVVVATPVA